MYPGLGGNQRAQQRPDPSQIADTLFSKLDTENKGYLEVADLETAFANLDSSSDTSAGDVFGQFDGDSDGKITKEELTSGLKSLAEELDSQFSAMRMGGKQDMPPPPPPPPGGEDQGLTQDELTSIAETSTDSELSTLMSELASNFDEADSNQDGTVSASEAMAYQAANGSSKTESDAGASGSSNEAAVMRQIMELMRAYGEQGSATASSSLSVTA